MKCKGLPLERKNYQEWRIQGNFLLSLFCWSKYFVERKTHSICVSLFIFRYQLVWKAKILSFLWTFPICIAIESINLHSILPQIHSIHLIYSLNSIIQSFSAIQFTHLIHSPNSLIKFHIVLARIITLLYYLAITNSTTMRQIGDSIKVAHLFIHYFIHSLQREGSIGPTQ